MPANEVEIVVTARDQTKGAVDQAKGGLGGLDGAFRRVAATAAGFLSANVIQSGAQAIIGFLGESTEAASNLAESGSKVDTVFGSSAEAIHSFAQNAASNFGLSEQAALDATGAFGNMFVQLGLSTDHAAALSQSMTGLAADFASFHNADISEVLEAQQAAFRGEYDALQRFTPLINAASVEQRAMADTGKENASELTAQEKALAVYALMMEGAGDAQGDFERTSEGAANQQRIANAEMENAQAAIGQKLMPVMQAITQAKLALANILVDKVIPAFEQFGQWISEHKELLAAIAIGIMAALVPAFVAWAVSAAAAAAATLVAAAPLILIGLAVAALAYLIITHWDTIKAATAAVFGFIQRIISGVIDWIRNNWPLLLAILTGPIGLAVLVISRHWTTIKNGFTAVKDWIAARISDVVGFFAGMPGRIAAVTSGLWNGIKNSFKAAINAIIGWWNGLGFTLPTIHIPGFDPPGPGPSFGGMDIGGQTFSTPNIGYLARGGIASGLTAVGERGMELLDLPAGTRVIPNSGVDRALADRAGSAEVLLRIEAGSSALDQLLVELLRRVIKVEHGGDVQAALGWSA